VEMRTCNSKSCRALISRTRLPANNIKTEGERCGSGENQGKKDARKDIECQGEEGGREGLQVNFRGTIKLRSSLRKRKRRNIKSTRSGPTRKSRNIKKLEKNQRVRSTNLKKTSAIDEILKDFSKTKIHTHKGNHRSTNRKKLTSRGSNIREAGDFRKDLVSRR